MDTTIKKKIIVTENQLKRLVNEVMEVANTSQQQFLNYLYEIGKPGKLTGTGNVDELYKNAIQDGLRNYITRNTDDPAITYTEEDIKELEKEFYDQHGEIIEKISIDETENLIYVYRGISIPKSNNGYYDNLIQYMNGLGLCWGVNRESAIAHEGYRDGKTVIICGKVSPDSINWPYSISIATDVKEDELRLLKGRSVEIYKVTYSDGEELDFNGPIIASTGNSKKWD
jgi:hypothetical protein